MNENKFLTTEVKKNLTDGFNLIKQGKYQEASNLFSSQETQNPYYFEADILSLFLLLLNSINKLRETAILSGIDYALRNVKPVSPLHPDKIDVTFFSDAASKYDSENLIDDSTRCYLFMGFALLFYDTYKLDDSNIIEHLKKILREEIDTGKYSSNYLLQNSIAAYEAFIEDKVSNRKLIKGYPLRVSMFKSSYSRKITLPGKDIYSFAVNMDVPFVPNNTIMCSMKSERIKRIFEKEDGLCAHTNEFKCRLIDDVYIADRDYGLCNYKLSVEEDDIGITVFIEGKLTKGTQKNLIVWYIIGFLFILVGIFSAGTLLLETLVVLILVFVLHLLIYLLALKNNVTQLAIGIENWKNKYPSTFIPLKIRRQNNSQEDKKTGLAWFLDQLGLDDTFLRD